MVLALPGPLIPRVIFVLEGWTSASLNLSVLPCPACPACPAPSFLPLPVFACLIAAHSRSRGTCTEKTSSARAVPRGNHDTEPRGAISEAAGCTSDSGGFINGDDILGGPGLDLLGPNLGHSDDGQALPAVLSNLFLNG